MRNFVPPAPAWRKKAESSETVIEILHVAVELVHGPDVQLEFVHGSDEERHYLRDELAGVALVILDGDRSVLLDPLQGGGGVEAVLGHERLDCGELIALNLFKCLFVLDQELGAVTRVLLEKEYYIYSILILYQFNNALYKVFFKTEPQLMKLQNHTP